jgi:hypothetical protein
MSSLKLWKKAQHGQEVRFKKLKLFANPHHLLPALLAVETVKVDISIPEEDLKWVDIWEAHDPTDIHFENPPPGLRLPGPEGLRKMNVKFGSGWD